MEIEDDMKLAMDVLGEFLAKAELVLTPVQICKILAAALAVELKCVPDREELLQGCLLAVVAIVHKAQPDVMVS